MSDTRQKVVEILASVLNKSVDDISTVDNFTDIEDWDSLNHLKVVLAIEEEIGIKFDIQEVMEVISISSAVNFIQNKRD